MTMAGNRPSLWDMKMFILLPACVCLAACGPPPPAAEDVSGGAIRGGPFAIDIALSMTPRATARLNQLRERLRIEAVYVLKPADPDDLQPLSAADITTLAADTISVPPASDLITAPGEVLSSLMDESETDRIHVLVTITVRRGREDLVRCGLYQGPLAMARQKPVDISCDLSG